MNRIAPALPSLLFAMLLAACPRPSAKEPLREISPESAASTQSALSSPEPPEAGEVRGRAMSVRSYCGGTPPPPSLIEELRTPKPEAGLTLLFRAGEKNKPGGRIAAEVKTDAEGRFSLKLPPGDYCVVDEAKRKKGPLPTFGSLVADKECYESWLSTCDLVFTLGKERGEEIEVLFERGCGDPVCVPIPPRP